MNELQAVLDGVDRLWAAGESAALATVVCVSGSAYRRPGARMLVAPGGVRQVGSVSGGCLEGDVARKAWQLTTEGPAILTYDSTAEDDGLWGLGLGCQGIIHVLVERLTPGDALAGFLRECLADRRRGLVATVFHADPGTGIQLGQRLLLRDDDGVPCASDDLVERLPELVDDAIRAMVSGRTVTAQYELAGGRVELLLEVVEPPPALVVFGAGWDAVPVVAGARSLGWHVTVVDRRAGYACRERFPDANAWIVSAARDVFDRVRMDRRTVVVIMTHSYPDDLPILHAALRTEAWYVGLLGPARRKDRLLKDLADMENFVATPEQLERLRGPVGLDIGGDNPAEIANSILSEIIATRHQREGGPLRERAAPIHDPLRSFQVA